jgi:hypothetical protein
MTSRRQLLKNVLLATPIGLCAVRGPGALAAAPRTPLDEQDATAKALGYRQDARSVDAQAYPAWRRGQSCSTCALVEFGTARLRGCSLFPGKLVAAGGWCSGWQQRGAKP